MTDQTENTYPADATAEQKVRLDAFYQDYDALNNLMAGKRMDDDTTNLVRQGLMHFVMTYMQVMKDMPDHNALAVYKRSLMVAAMGRPSGESFAKEMRRLVMTSTQMVDGAKYRDDFLDLPDDYEPQEGDFTLDMTESERLDVMIAARHKAVLDALGNVLAGKNIHEDDVIVPKGEVS